MAVLDPKRLAMADLAGNNRLDSHDPEVITSDLEVGYAATMWESGG